jgi:hypothetical protein
MDPPRAGLRFASNKAGGLKIRLTGHPAFGTMPKTGGDTMKTRLILILAVGLLAVMGGCGKNRAAMKPDSGADPHGSIWTQTTYSDGSVGGPIMAASVPQDDPNAPRPVNPTVSVEQSPRWIAIDCDPNLPPADRMSCAIMSIGVWEGKRIAETQGPHVFFTEDGRRYDIRHDGSVVMDDGFYYFNTNRLDRTGR